MHKKMNWACALGAMAFATRGPIGLVVALNGIFFHLSFPTSEAVRAYDTATNCAFIAYCNYTTRNAWVHALSSLGIFLFLTNDAFVQKRTAASDALHVFGVQAPFFAALVLWQME